MTFTDFYRSDRWRKLRKYLMHELEVTARWIIEEYWRYLK